MHIMAVVVAPFVGGFGMLLLALRGGGTKTVFSRFRRAGSAWRTRSRAARSRRRRSGPRAAEPVPSLTPLNSTWPPATW